MTQAPEIVLDLSRLVSRVLRATPTGVDRVEFQYARHLLDRIPDRLSFAAQLPYGVHGRLPQGAVRQFLSHAAALWRSGATEIDTLMLRMSAVRQLSRLVPCPAPAPVRPRILLQVSPQGLEQPDRLKRILKRERARFVCMVHDLIPITHPEYARPGGAAQHRQRMATVARHAAGIIANSAATSDTLHAVLGTAGPLPPVLVTHLGTEPIDPVAVSPLPTDRPYYVCVGTIEPRKNHLLLLNLWRQLAGEMPDAPRLILIGRRGWENEQVIDMLERCPPLRGLVVEHGSMSDLRMQELIRRASALLMPSFAEGFGMPVTEALAAGTPVIVSDIPALREIGGGVPEFLDPLDGPGWLSAIRAYADPAAPRRLAQLDRMASWQPVRWETHVDAALAFIDGL